MALTSEDALAQVRAQTTPTLDELARRGAQQMIAQALYAEVAEYVAIQAQPQDEQGHALVVRNGKGRSGPCW